MRTFAKFEQVLERGLRLIHLTFGQPARSTEMLSLQCSNVAQGQCRSIFIEEGLISTVASSHEGYNVTEFTKAIHQYSTKEVNKLLLYYL
jgi:hypothetical protein